MNVLQHVGLDSLQREESKIIYATAKMIEQIKLGQTIILYS